MLALLEYAPHGLLPLLACVCARTSQACQKLALRQRILAFRSNYRWEGRLLHYTVEDRFRVHPDRIPRSPFVELGPFEAEFNRGLYFYLARVELNKLCHRFWLPLFPAIRYPGLAYY